MGSQEPSAVVPVVPGRVLCRICLALSPLLVTACIPGGWERAGQTGDDFTGILEPTADRLMAMYDDLATRRFQVIADFERPEQATLFRFQAANAPGSAVLSTERPRSRSGVGSLKMAFYDASQRVVAADSPAAAWGLHRNWTRYELMLFSVFSPRKMGGFRVAVQSGTDEPLVYAHPRILLRPGWNLIRVDLGDMIDHIDLADVREIRFWCDPLDTPIELHLDDLILTDNTREVFGTPDGEEGDIYVRTAGRRLVVGAVDRFELVFSRGRIRRWFDLGHDPGRTANLVGLGALGPSPVVLPEEEEPSLLLDDLRQWTGLGIAAEVFQDLVDATPLSVTIESEWRFGYADTPPTDASPYHRWVYTVYHDGRIFVECSGTARTADFEPPGLGVIFCCDGALGFDRPVWDADRAAPSDASPETAFALFSRRRPGQADLLVVPFGASPPPRVLLSDEDPRLCVLWPVATAAHDMFVSAVMMRVWPTDIDTPTQAAAMAADYGHPLPVHLDTGRLVRTDPGDFDNDGFSESRGYYSLQLEGSSARLRIDGTRFPRFSPVFKVVDVRDRDLWVYVDGRVLDGLHRDRDGNVMFQVPAVMSGEMLVEITSRLRDAPAGVTGLDRP